MTALEFSGEAEATINGMTSGVEFSISLAAGSLWNAGWYWLAYGEDQQVYSRKAHYLLADTGGVDTPTGSLCGLGPMTFDTPCEPGCDGCDACHAVLCRRCQRIKAKETP